VQTIRLLFLNSTAQIIGRVLTGLASTVIYAIVARSLGQSGLGEFTLMSVYAGVFYTASDFGFNAIALRIAAGEEEKLRLEYRDLLGLRIILGAVLIFLAVAILNFLPYSSSLKLATIVISLTILTQALLNTAGLAFQFKLRYDLSAVAAVVGSLVNLGLVYLLAQGNLSLVLIAMTYVFAGIVSASLAIGAAKHLIGELRPAFRVAEWWPLIISSIPVGLTLFFNLVYFRADTFILSFLKPTTDVGIYGAAYKPFELAITIPTFFMNALYPLLIREFEKNRRRFRQMVRFSIIGLAGISIVGAIVGIVMAPTLTALLYGPGYSESVLPFQILIASAPIYFLSALYMWLLLILKKQNAMAAVYIGGLALNVALNLYFIPKFTYLASAVITGVSEGVILILTFYLARSWKYEDD
jgi:O-antigen/teichoic acid export membrane protein